MTACDWHRVSIPMAKDKRDRDTLDWVDDSEERRQREEQEYARRQARKDKHARRDSEEDPTDRKVPRSRS